MKVVNFGAGLIGAILLLTGVALVFTDIDPLLICFKQCNIPRALANFFGVELYKILSGTFYAVLGVLFLAPVLKKSKRQK
jgi:hypothetical protein